MQTFGVVQALPYDVLEKKLGRRLSVGDTFETKTGTWKVVSVGESVYKISLVMGKEKVS